MSNRDDVLDRFTDKLAEIFDHMDTERIKAEVLEESRLKRERSEKNKQRANKEEKPDPYQAIVKKYQRRRAEQ